MKSTCCVFLLVSLCLGAFGQSKSEIKALGIKSTTVVEYDYSSGKDSKRTESLKRFNQRGDVIEYIDFDKAGKQKERIVYKYNENFDVVEEVFYDEDNKVEKTYKYTYDGRLRKTKEKYDSNQKLLWKKEYIYEM